MFAKHNQNRRITNSNKLSFLHNNKFPIKWKITDFVKILGIHFDNDIEMTNRYNIIKCIQKIENNVKFQTRDTFP